MNKIKPLQIGELIARIPIIQGGMGVGVSLSSLAGAVAKEGAIGIISTAQIGYRESDFDEQPLQANLRAIQKEVQKARKIAPKGIIGVNIMVATRQYSEYVKEAVRAKVDLIISGAGLPVDLPKIAKEEWERLKSCGEAV
ncbi:MAG TPA: nitronate monooxygenase, partial [Lachnospiraceae bacterium]|nr:nitronate monooxygenase [Lachnospiraceae bacterium]